MPSSHPLSQENPGFYCQTCYMTEYMANRYFQYCGGCRISHYCVRVFLNEWTNFFIYLNRAKSVRGKTGLPISGVHASSKKKGDCLRSRRHVWPMGYLWIRPTPIWSIGSRYDAITYWRARPLTKIKNNRSTLHHLVFQALAGVHPSSPKYDHFVGILAKVEVIPPNENIDKTHHLGVQVDHLFTRPLDEVKEYFQEDEMTVAMQSFLEEREKCRAAGFDRIAAFLIVPALAIVRFIPIIV